MSVAMRFALVLLLAGVAACGGPEEGDPGEDRADTEGEAARSGEARQASGAPQVEERYQERVDEAWQEAVAGENPSATCAGIKGRAATSPVGSAIRALEACNVDIPARYFLTYVDRVEAGEHTCINLMTELTTKLPGMTISMEGFRDLAVEGGEMDTSEAAGAGAAIIAGAAASGGGADDPRQMVKERIRDRVTQVCPEQAGIILR